MNGRAENRAKRRMLKPLAAWTVAVALGTGVALVPNAARAQASGEDKTAAEALFAAARELMQAGNYASACPKLVDSQRLDPGIGTLLNLALCYKQNGQTASAWTTYREVAGQARAAGQADREQVARAEAEQLEPKLVKLKILLGPSLAQLNGLEISRDGKPVIKGLWDVPTPVDPGTHVVEARAPGKIPRKATIDVAGEGKVYEIEVQALNDDVAGTAAPAPAATPGAASPAQPTQAPPPDQGTTQASAGKSPLGFVVLGAGAVAAGAGVLFALKTKSKNDEASGICPTFPNGNCEKADVTRHATLMNDAKTSRTISYVGFGLGAALIATGAILIASGGSDTSSSDSPAAGSKAPHLPVSASIDPSGFSLEWLSRF